VHRKTHILKVVLAVSLALAIPSNASAATETITACGSSANQLTIPAAQTINITIEGAGGAGGDSASGGGGGLIELEYQASDDEILELYAGCGGVNSNGAGGAGYVAGSPGENTDGTTGGGGGSSAVLGGNNNKIASAGGGGGAGYGGGFLGIGAGAGGAGGGEGNTGGAGGTTDTPAGGDGSPIINQGTAVNQQTGGGGGGGASGSDGSDGQVVVEYNIPPTVRSNKTFNGTDQNNLVEKEQYVSSDTLTVRSNVTDPDSELGEILLSIRDPTGDLTLDNASMSQIDTVNIDGDSGATFERDFNFPYIFLGDWSYTIWASDQPGLLNDSQGSFEMIDLTPPETRNTFQNRTLMTIHNTVLLQAEGYDNWNLSHAVLATNETGEWENKTDSYGSPKTPYTFQTWTTTGFAWKNNSMTGNKSVHWRVWYNDISGQHSVTETNSFRVRENFNWKGVESEEVGFTRESPRRAANGRTIKQAVDVQNIHTRLVDLGRVKNSIIDIRQEAVRSQVIKPAVAESMSTALRNDRLSDGARNFMTGTAFSNPTARVNSIGRIFSQAIAIDTDFTRYFTGMRNQIEEYSAEEISVRQQDLSRAAPASIIFNSDITREGNINRILYETFTGNEKIYRSFTGDRDLNSDLEVGQTSTRSVFSSRSFSQTIAGAETVESLFTGSRLVSDQITSSDTTFRSLSNLRTVAESAGFTENRYTSSNLARLFSQRISSEQAETRTALNLRTLTEEVSSENQVISATSVSRTVLETTGFQQNLVTDSVLQRVFESSYSPALNELTYFSGSRITEQIIEAGNLQNRETSSFRLNQVITGFSADETSVSALGRILNTDILQTAETDRSIFSSRNIQETVEGLEKSYRTSYSQRAVTDDLKATDSQSRFLESGRFIASNIAFDAVSARTATSSRSFNQIINYNQMLLSTFTGERNLNTDIEGEEDLERNTLQARTRNNLISGSFTGSRSLLSARQRSLGITATDTVSRAADTARIVAEATGIQAAADQQIFNIRQVSDIYSGNENINTFNLLQRTESLSTGYLDRQSSSSEISRLQTTELATGINTPRNIDIQRILTDAFIAAPDQTGARLQVRKIIEQFGFTADPERNNLLNQRTISSSFNSALEVSINSMVSRQEDTELGIATSSVRESLNLRAFSQSINPQSFTEAESLLGRTQSEEIASEDNRFSTSDVRRRVIESTSVGLIPARNLAVTRTENSGIGYSSVEQQLTESIRNQILAVATSDNTQRTSSTGRTVAQILPLQQAADRSLLSQRTEISVLTGQFAETASTNMLRAVIDSIGLNTETAARSAVNRVVENIVELSSAENRNLAQQRAFSSEITIAENSISALSINRMVSATLTGDTSVEGTPSAGRQVTEILTAGTVPETASGISRTTSTGIQNTILGASTGQLLRNQFAELGFNSDTSNSMVLNRFIQDGISITGAFSQSGSLNRLFSQETGLNLEATGSGMLRRVQSTSLNAQTATELGSDVSRSVLQSFTGTSEASNSVLASRSISEILASSAGLDRRTTQQRTERTRLSISDNIISTGIFSRVFYQRVQPNLETITRTRTPRVVSDSLSLNADTEAALNVFREDILNVNAGQTRSVISMLNRFNQESISTENSVQVSSSVARAVTETLLMNSDSSIYSQTFRQVTENGIFTDQTSGSAVSARLVLLNVGAGIDETGSGFFSRTVQEMAYLQDERTGSPSIGRYLSTVLQIDNQAQRESSSARSVIFGIENSFTVSGSGNLLRAVEESFSSDVGSEALSSLSRNIQQDLNTGEQQLVTTGLARLTSQHITSDIGAVRSINLDRRLEETLGLDNTLSANSFLGRNLNPEILATESSGRQLTLNVVQSQLVGLESVQTGGRTALRAISEEVLTTESTDRINQAAVRTAEQTLTVQTLISAQDSGLRTVLLDIETGNSQGRNTVTQRLLQTGFSAATAFNTGSILERAIGANIRSTASTLSDLQVFRNLQQEIVANSGNSRQLMAGRFLETETSLQDSLSGQPLVSRLVEDYIQTSDSQDTSQIAERSLNEIAGYTGTVDRSADIFTLINQGVGPDINSVTSSRIGRIFGTSTGVENRLATDLSLQRVLVSGLGFEDQQESSPLVFRTLSSTFSLDNSPAATLDIERGIEQLLSPVTESGSRLSAGRTILSEIGATGSERTGLLTSRATSTAVTYSSALSSQRSVLALVSESFQTGVDPVRSISIGRAVGGSIGIQDSAFPDFNLFQVVVDTVVGVDDTPDRTVSISRQISEDYGFGWFFDSFIFGDEPQIPEDPDTGGEGSDGSTGGGFPAPPTEPVAQPELSFAGNRLTVKLAPGETSTASAELENTGEAEADTRLEVRRINMDTVNAIQLQQTNYTIEAGSAVDPVMNITAPAYLEDGNISNRVLERSLYASAGNSEASIPVNVLIESEEKQLLDVRLDLEENEITEGESADYSFEIFNLGETGRVDIELFTTVTNSTGHVIHEEKEELAVQTSASVARNLDVDLPPGQYKVKVDARYGDKDASSFSTLRVQEPSSNFGNVAVALGIVGLMILSALLAVLGYKKVRLPRGLFIRDRLAEIRDYAESHEIDFEKLARKEEEDSGYSHVDFSNDDDDLAKREWIPSPEDKEESENTESETSKNKSNSSQHERSEENDGRPTVDISDVEKGETSSKDSESASPTEETIKDIHRDLKESLED
jgi:hypothetical protein